jgi:PmbA protein
MNDGLIGNAEMALKYALDRGADEAEVIVTKAEILTINIENGDTRFGGTDEHQGIGVRVVKNNSLGFTYATLLSDSMVKEMVDRAFKVASVMKKDKFFFGFTEPKPPTKVDGVYDPALAFITYDEAKSQATRIIESAEALSKGIVPTFGVFESSLRWFAILNSNDLCADFTGTSVSAGVRTLYDYGTGTSNGLAFQNSRQLKNIDPENIGERASSMALMSKNPTKVGSEEATIILDPDAVAGLFQGVLLDAFNGDVVQKKGSFLYGKMGEKIASEDLTIIDDGTLYDGCKTSSIDYEGAPTQRNVLIKRGILQGYLYDKYTADKERKVSTGNAVRSGGFGPYRDSRGREYRFPPKVGCTNFVVEKGMRRREEMIDEVDNGYLISFAVGGGSPSSGDFSADARNVYKIERGEIVFPVRQAVFTGNISDLLMNIEEIGVNSRSSGGLNPGEIYAPSLMIKKGLVVGDL